LVIFGEVIDEFIFRYRDVLFRSDELRSPKMRMERIPPEIRI
jgi:hypothetical protein